MAQNMHTEWVECPYCRKVIQAPNEPDVTFYCPDCGRELITYDKEKINEAMEKGHSNDALFVTVADVPREVKNGIGVLFCLIHFGGFLMVYIGLLGLH